MSQVPGPDLTLSPATKPITEVLLSPRACVSVLLIIQVAGEPEPLLWTQGAPGQRFGWPGPMREPFSCRAHVPEVSGLRDRQAHLQDPISPGGLLPSQAQSMTRESSKEAGGWAAERGRHPRGWERGCGTRAPGLVSPNIKGSQDSLSACKSGYGKHGGGRQLALGISFVTQRRES